MNFLHQESERFEDTTEMLLMNKNFTGRQTDEPSFVPNVRPAAKPEKDYNSSEISHMMLIMMTI